MTLALAGATRAQPKPEAASGGIEQKLDAMILPKLELREASLTEAVAFLRAKSMVLDPEKAGVNMAIAKNGEAAAKNAKITLSLANVPVSEALRYVAELAGVKLRFEAYAVVLDR